MQFRFVTPSLAKLDELDLEVLVATFHSDVRPCRGIVGLCDFRMGGRLSKLLTSGFVTGAWGEVLMLPGKPFLTVDKLLLFGAGPEHELDAERAKALIHDYFVRLDKLRARAAAVELPGRANGVLSPAEAARLLLDEAQHDWGPFAWTLAESTDDRTVIESLVQEQRRRQRRGL